jgi:hypothetical protein
MGILVRHQGEPVKNSRPCCQAPSALAGRLSPFSQIVALEFYDGPTSGVLQCEACKTPVS